MKYLNQISMTALVFFTLMACSKDEFENKDVNTNLNVETITGVSSKQVGSGNGFTVIEYGRGGRTTGTTILNFNDLQAVEDLATQLENQVDTWNDVFVAQWNSLTDDQLDAKKDLLGFDDDQPLTDFENANNMTSSLRRKFMAEEAVWLNNSVLDDANDPNAKLEYGFNNAVMALMNDKGEIKVQNNIYKIVVDGYLNISDGDLQKLLRYNEGDMTVLNEPGVSIDPSINIDDSNTTETRTSCKRGATDGYSYYETNKRAFLKISLRSYPWKAVAKSQIISYKKSGNKWKRHTRTMSAGSFGIIYDRNCANNFNYSSEYKTKRRKELYHRREWWEAFPDKKTQAGQLAGKFLIGGQYKTVTLQ